MTEVTRERKNERRNIPQYKDTLCGACQHPRHRKGQCLSLEDGNPHGVTAEFAPCLCSEKSERRKR